MFYRKNLPGWERAMRVVGGVAMIAWGLLAMPAWHRLCDRRRRRGRDRDRIFRILPDVRHGRAKAAVAVNALARQAAAIPR